MNAKLLKLVKRIKKTNQKATQRLFTSFYIHFSAAFLAQFLIAC